MPAEHATHKLPNSTANAAVGEWCFVALQFISAFRRDFASKVKLSSVSDCWVFIGFWWFESGFIGFLWFQSGFWWFLRGFPGLPWFLRGFLGF